MAKADKVKHDMLKGAITAESLSKLNQALTGREFTPEEMAEARKRIVAARMRARQRK
jgi:hypothetical protein